MNYDLEQAFRDGYAEEMEKIALDDSTLASYTKKKVQRMGIPKKMWGDAARDHSNEPGVARLIAGAMNQMGKPHRKGLLRTRLRNYTEGARNSKPPRFMKRWERDKGKKIFEIYKNKTQ